MSEKENTDNIYKYIYIYILNITITASKYHHLQPIMKQGESYIRDTGDFSAKLKAAGEVLKGAILVTADVVGLYLSIPHSEGLDILKKQYKNYPKKNVSTENIVKMADFVLKNNLFGFVSKFYKQI